MTLPDICPKDGSSQCKGSSCHLYIVDWRSGDEQCIIGYSATHKKITSSHSVEDTYAESTRRRTGRNIGHKVVDYSARSKSLESVEGRVVPESSLEAKKLEFVSEKLVVNNKDTMVFESTTVTEEVSVEDKKRKTIDDLMDLDLPGDYEEEFWK